MNRSSVTAVEEAMVFDILGKLFFPHQQEWQRRRNAKIMTYVVVASLVCGLVLVLVFKLMNARL